LLDRCLSFCPFFGIALYPSSIYDFWSPRWYLQALLTLIGHTSFSSHTCYMYCVYCKMKSEGTKMLPKATRQ